MKFISNNLRPLWSHFYLSFNIFVTINFVTDMLIIFIFIFYFVTIICDHKYFYVVATF